MTALRRWASDESLWVTVGAVIAGVLASIPGLAPIAPVVRAAIDGGAAGVAAVYVGGVAHRKATATKTAAATTTTAAGGGGSPQQFAALVADFAKRVDELAAKG